MSFSLCAVIAEGAKENKPGPARLDRGNAFLQCTDGLGAQVALLQSPIPPAVTTSLFKPRNTPRKKHEKHRALSFERT